MGCFKILNKMGDFTMEQSRPLDALNKSKGKRVVVELKGGRQYVGLLNAFDIHVNIVLNEAEERENNELKRKVGTVFIRGDTITIIFPE
jgi:small nuclear ribonucleoprotein